MTWSLAASTRGRLRAARGVRIEPQGSVEIREGAVELRPLGIGRPSIDEATAKFGFSFVAFVIRDGAIELALSGMGFAAVVENRKSFGSSLIASS